MKNRYVKFGYDCCEKMEKAGIPFDGKKCANLLRSPERVNAFQNDEEMRQFIIDFNCFVVGCDKHFVS